jgi:monofunctional biosynthetic peptidoglycan transglycosylase
LRAALIWGLRGALLAVVLTLAWIAVLAVVTPPPNLYMRAERARLGAIAHDWVPLAAVSPHMARAAVAAEDANFCLHWGFDMAAIRTALDEGSGRGASTIPQQTVKNVFLWPERSWLRKAIEAVLTPAVVTLWSRRRVLEVYLNVAEFGEGVFGVEAAARHHFGTAAADLTLVQAARLAAILPDPKGRDPARPSAFVRRRSEAIARGAETIRADGRDRCFQPG